jgi:MscS family membrane protein
MLIAAIVRNSKIGRRMAGATLLFALIAPVARSETARQPAGEELSAPAAGPSDELGRETPRGSVVGFLEACRAGDYEKAGRFLDLGAGHPLHDSLGTEEVARRLKIVLDQKLWVEPEKLSDDPRGQVGDGLPEGVDQVGTIILPSGRSIVVLVSRSELGDPRPWLIARSTVERVPQLWEAYGYGRIRAALPAVFFETRLFEIQLWQWIALVIMALAAFLLSMFAAAVVRRLLAPFVSRTRTDVDDRLLGLSTSPLRLAIAVAFFSVGSLTIGLAVPAQQTLNGLEKGLGIVAVAWLLLRVIDIVAESLRHRLEEEGRSAAVAVVPAARRTVKVLIVALALLAMLQNLGFNVTGLLAGLGIGGLAVALAAQRTIENFFGGLAVVADQPVRVGDFCSFGGRVGTVEDVGIWSTKVRTLDRTLITIPNGQFSGYELENYARRDRIRLNTMIGLRYETTPDQLRHVLAGLRKVLLAHPRVTPEPARVRFVGYGASSLDLEVFAYVDTQDFNEFLGIREDIFLRFMDVVEQSGTGFAFPSQTVYFGRDEGLDAEKARAAEEQVRRWRSEGSLPFPQFGEDVVREIDDTLDFPPEGSALRRADD